MIRAYKKSCWNSDRPAPHASVVPLSRALLVAAIAVVGGVWSAAPARAQVCIVGDPAQMPPICLGGNGYVSPDDLHMILDGLPPGTEIQMDAAHIEFLNSDRAPGGSLGGSAETFDSVLCLDIQGVGAPPIGGVNRFLCVPLACETHTAARNPGDPVQSFDTDMFRCQGALTPNVDPDFCTLEITAGTDFGLPSPGHTTITDIGGGQWAVDSFFDITYRIDFQGCPGSFITGMSGTTTGTVRMQSGLPAVRPGQDGWETIDPSDVTFGPPGDLPEIVGTSVCAGAVGNFSGAVQLVGQPLGLPELPEVDTIVERLTTASLPTIPSQATIDIEMIALDLRSAAPITIPGCGDYDVQVTNDPLNPSLGTMIIDRDSAEGGTFTSSINVQTEITLIPVVGNLNPPVTLPTQPLLLENLNPHPWTHVCPLILVPPFGPNFWPPFGLPNVEIHPAGANHAVVPGNRVPGGGPPPDLHGDWLPNPTDPNTSPSQVTFGSAEVPGILADFFGPNSAPIPGVNPPEQPRRLCLRGEPLAPATGNAHTKLQRVADPVLPTDPIGQIGFVPIEIVQLSLVSCEPLTVESIGPLGPLFTQWDVRVEVAGVPPPPSGQVTATKTHANGGVFTADFIFWPRFVFSGRKCTSGEPCNVDADCDPVVPLNACDPATVTLDTLLEGQAPVRLEILGPPGGTGAPYVEQVDPNLGVLVGTGAQWVSGIEEDPITQQQQVVPLAAETADGGFSISHVVCPPTKPPVDVHVTWVAPLPGGATSTTVVDFSPATSDIPPLPADFFYQGSAPFVQPVPMRGCSDCLVVPNIGSSGKDGLAPAVSNLGSSGCDGVSVRMQRTEDPVRASDPDGTVRTVEIEMVQLSLRSESPITIPHAVKPIVGHLVISNLGSSGKDGFPSAIAGVPVGGLAPGTLTATKTKANGGTFTANFPLCPLISFVSLENRCSVSGDPCDTDVDCTLGEICAPLVRQLDHCATLPPLDMSIVNPSGLPTPFVFSVLPGLDLEIPQGAQWVPGIEHEDIGGAIAGPFVKTQTVVPATVVSGGGGVSHIVCPPPPPPPPDHHATWVSPFPGGLDPKTTVDFGLGDTPQIPADFFYPGSASFSGQVEMDGAPFSPESDTSVILQRSADPFQLADLPSAIPVTVEIEIVQLSLVSTAPITVTGANPDETWLVAVDLSAVNSPKGSVTATKTHANGGTYDSVIPVQPRFVFTRQSDNAVRVLDTGLSNPPIPPIVLESQGDPWVHQVDPDFELDIDPAAKWVPGIDQPDPLDITSQQLATLVEASNDGIPPSVIHVVCPGRRKVCLYEIPCVDGTDCMTCPFDNGSLCRGPRCPPNACPVLVGLTSLCGDAGTNCCMEYGPFNCKVPVGKVPRCPTNLIDCACNKTCDLDPNDTLLLCQNLQTAQCTNPTNGTDLCLPVNVSWTLGPIDLEPTATTCECNDATGCGPVTITPSLVFGLYDISCSGACPMGTVPPCEVIITDVNGQDTSAGASISSSVLNPGDSVRCGCPPPAATCPPDPNDPLGLCSNPAAGECIGDPANLCLATTVFTTLAGNIVTCECDDPMNTECGPVHSDGVDFFCDPDCPVGVPGACVIHYGNVPQFQLGGSVAIAQVPNGVTVTCDCAVPPPNTCPLDADDPLQLCAPLQATDCLGAAGDTCLPTHMQFIQPGGAVATSCACFTPGPGDCGPITISTGPAEPLMSCSGNCPPNTIGPCQVVIEPAGGGADIFSGNGVPISTLMPGDGARCDCMPSVPPPPCPPETNSPLCVNPPVAECVSGVQPPIDLCLTSSVTVSSLGLQDGACACVDPQSTTCGPVHSDGMIFSCDPNCPVGETGTCIIHYNGAPQAGVTSVAIAQVPTTPPTAVTCQCFDPGPNVCPLDSADTLQLCAPLQDTQCINPVAGELCLPTGVTASPVDGTVTATACDCFTPGVGNCGPMTIDETLGFPAMSCSGTCPLNTVPPCQVVITPAGGGPDVFAGNSVPLFSLMPGDSAVCGCEPPGPQVCDEPPGQTLCSQAGLQSTECTDLALGDTCLPRCLNYDPLTGLVRAVECRCQGADECHAVAQPIPPGGVIAGTGGACTVPDNGNNTVTLPPAGCEYLSADEVHMILDGLPGTTMIELGAIHEDFICGQGADVMCSTPIPGFQCEDDGGDLGGKHDCFSSTITLDLTGIGAPLDTLTGQVVIPNVMVEVHTGLRDTGTDVQTFPTDMFRLEGQIFGDPDFDLLQIVGGTDFGLPSPGETTLTKRTDGNWNVDSFFDISYAITYVGSSTPGHPLNGLSGMTTGTLRMSTGAMPKCDGICPPGESCREEVTDNADGTINVCCDCQAQAATPKPAIHPVFGVPCLSDADCVTTTGTNPVGQCVPDGAGQFPGTCYVMKNRYISIGPNPANAGIKTARRVRTVPGGVTVGWVGPPQLVVPGSPIETPVRVAIVQPTPHFMEWSSVGTVHVGDCEISPGDGVSANAYAVSSIHEGADLGDAASYSAELVLRTTPRYGDTVGALAFPGQARPPDGATNFVDIFAAVSLFTGINQVASTIWVDVAPEVPDQFINFADIFGAVNGFTSAGTVYPFPRNPCLCPDACP